MNVGLIIGKWVKLLGLVVYDFYFWWDEYVVEVVFWIVSGDLKFVEDCVNGFENVLVLFECLMNGKNKGKVVVIVLDEFL